MSTRHILPVSVPRAQSGDGVSSRFLVRWRRPCIGGQHCRLPAWALSSTLGPTPPWGPRAQLSLAQPSPHPLPQVSPVSRALPALGYVSGRSAAALTQSAPDMEFLEVLTEGLNRVLLVRGSGREVITIYS